MATGRNSKSKEEVKEGLLSYLSMDHDEKELKTLAEYSPDDLAEIYEFEIHEHKEALPDDLE